MKEVHFSSAKDMMLMNGVQIKEVDFTLAAQFFVCKLLENIKQPKHVSPRSLHERIWMELS